VFQQLRLHNYIQVRHINFNRTSFQSMIKRKVSVFDAVYITPTPSPGILFRHRIKDRISGNITSLVSVTSTPFLFLHYSLNNSIPFPPFQHLFPAPLFLTFFISIIPFLRFSASFFSLTHL